MSETRKRPLLSRHKKKMLAGIGTVLGVAGYVLGHLAKWW